MKMALKAALPAQHNRLYQAVRSVFMKWLSELGDSLMDYSLIVDEESFINQGFVRVDLGLVPWQNLGPLCVIKIAYDEPKEKWLSEIRGCVSGRENSCRLAIVVEIHEKPDETRQPPPAAELWRCLPFMHRHDVGQLATSILQFCNRRGYHLTERFSCKIHVQYLRETNPELIWECEFTEERVYLPVMHDAYEGKLQLREVFLPEWETKRVYALPFLQLLEAMPRSLSAHEYAKALHMAGMKKKELLPPVENCENCRLCKSHSEPFEFLRRMYRREAEQNEKEERERQAKENRNGTAKRATPQEKFVLLDDNDSLEDADGELDDLEDEDSEENEVSEYEDGDVDGDTDMD
ncbi:hypothetical protein LOZ66_003515 [Ophidiomyces ophidiicola]|nr:hypothetical protein LOZ66_003515 [Ophidiomyces ophidiicola]